VSIVETIFIPKLAFLLDDGPIEKIAFRDTLFLKIESRIILSCFLLFLVIIKN
jgi:hypothetical protein